MQIKHTVEKELREWEPGGEYVTHQLDRIWTKYTGNPPPYALRDPKIDEKRVLAQPAMIHSARFGPIPVTSRRRPGSGVPHSPTRAGPVGAKTAASASSRRRVSPSGE